MVVCVGFFGFGGDVRGRAADTEGEFGGVGVGFGGDFDDGARGWEEGGVAGGEGGEVEGGWGGCFGEGELEVGGRRGGAGYGGGGWGGG